MRALDDQRQQQQPEQKESQERGRDPAGQRIAREPAIDAVSARVEAAFSIAACLRQGRLIRIGKQVSRRPRQRRPENEDEEGAGDERQYARRGNGGAACEVGEPQQQGDAR